MNEAWQNAIEHGHDVAVRPSGSSPPAPPTTSRSASAMTAAAPLRPATPPAGIELMRALVDDPELNLSSE